MTVFTPTGSTLATPRAGFTNRWVTRFTNTGTAGNNLSSAIYDPRTVPSYEAAWVSLGQLVTTTEA